MVAARCQATGPEDVSSKSCQTHCRPVAIRLPAPASPCSGWAGVLALAAVSCPVSLSNVSARTTASAALTSVCDAREVCRLARKAGMSASGASGAVAAPGRSGAPRAGRGAWRRSWPRPAEPGVGRRQVGPERHPMPSGVVDLGRDLGARRHDRSARRGQEAGQVEFPAEPRVGVRADGGGARGDLRHQRRRGQVDDHVRTVGQDRQLHAGHAERGGGRDRGPGGVGRAASREHRDRRRSRRG